MLIVSDSNKEPVRVPVMVRGTTIEITIRPWDEDEIDNLRAKNRRHDFALNTETQRMERVESQNIEALGEDILDHLIVDFSGVGSSKDKPWPVDRKHKLKLASIPVFKDEIPLWKAIQEKAKDLATAIKIEKEVEIKNS